MSLDRSSRRAFLALAGSAALAGCTTGAAPSGNTPSETTDSTSSQGTLASEGSWPQVGRDVAHTGYDPTTSAAEPSLAWTQSLKGPLTTPTVVGDTVYLTRGAPTGGAPDATFEAYALDSGERRWSESLDATFGFSAPQSNFRPVYHRGTFYLVVDDEVVAIDAESRERTWEWTGGTGVNDPIVVTDDAVYACDVIDDRLVCLNHDGSERWEFSGRSMRSPRLPAVADGTVYASVGAAVVALNAEDGSTEWRYAPDGDAHLSTSFATVADEAVVRAGRGAVEVIYLDGNKRWRANGLEVGIRPAVADGRVFTADLSGNAAAYALDSGERLWRKTVQSDAKSRGTVPVAADGALLTLRVTDGGTTGTALDAESGERNWRLERPATRARGPVPSNGTVVFTAEETPEEQMQNSTMSAGQDTTSTLYAFTE